MLKKSAVLVELGTHAPLGAAMAFGALSEKALIEPLWESLPERSLLISDRYYGQAPVLQELQRQCESRGSHFLMHVRDGLNVKVQRPCGDGNAHVTMTLREREPDAAGDVGQQQPAEPAARLRGRPRKHPSQRVSELTVREVRGRVQNGGGQLGEGEAVDKP